MHTFKLKSQLLMLVAKDISRWSAMSFSYTSSSFERREAPGKSTYRISERAYTLLESFGLSFVLYTF